MPTMIVGGNFTLGGRSSNLAQYDPKLKLWIDQFEPDLYVYGATSGSVYDIATNRSVDGSGFDELYVVGAFDTICKTCQAQFCSVGRWTGQRFHKVGEGLCSSQSDPTITIQALIVGNDGDLFVGGAFDTRVWNGSAFVTVANLAVFQGERNQWLPLTGGQLGCTPSHATATGGEFASGCNNVSVRALAWDRTLGMLFVAGTFNTIDGRSMDQPGLAYWNASTGLVSFPAIDPPRSRSSDVDNGTTAGPSNSTSVSFLTYDRVTQSLFVAGDFTSLNGSACHGLAVFRLSTSAISPPKASKHQAQQIHRQHGHTQHQNYIWHAEKGSTQVARQRVARGKWSCLARKPDHAFDTVTALLYDEVSRSLFVAGKPSNESTWLTHAQQQEAATASSTAHRAHSKGGTSNLESDILPRMPHTIARYYYRKIANATGSGSSSSSSSKRKRGSGAGGSKIGSHEMRRTTDANVDGMQSSSLGNWLRSLSSAAASQSALSSSSLSSSPSSSSSSSSIHTQEVPTYERVWEWLPKFEGTNGDILSLYFQPYITSNSNPTRLSSSTFGSSFRASSAASDKKQQSDKSNDGKGDDDKLHTDDTGLDHGGASGGGGGGSGDDTSTVEISDEGNLIIAGAFTNYQAVAIWVNDAKFGPRTMDVETDANPIVPGSGVGGITGLVTSVTPMIIPTQDKPHVVVYKDYTRAFIITCVTLGVLLGILSAFLCHYYTYVPWLRAVAEGKQGIALQTLSYGIVPDIDITESYTRAMKVS